MVDRDSVMATALNTHDVQQKMLSYLKLVLMLKSAVNNCLPITVHWRSVLSYSQVLF